MTTAQTLQTLSYTDPYPHQTPQLLIDISGIKRYNSHTGIPRVVLNQLQALKELDQDIFHIRAIYLSEHPSTPPLHFYAATHTPISLARGDIIYIPDLDPQSIKKATNHHLFECYKNIGIYIVTLIHDILPITHPHFFVKNQDKIHKEWLTHIYKVSDMLITTTHATATTLKTHTQNHPPLATIPLGTTTLSTHTVIPGSNPSVIPGSNPSVIPGSDPESHPNTQPNFLMVSTIEPRKAHTDILNAFELLWAEDKAYHLTIVGKQGWNIEHLIKRIHTHPKNGSLLHYKSFVDDTELHTLYTNATALIVASYAEGFGLPLIEAAHYHLPIIARDIPVFREIATEHAFYFPDTTEPHLIADSIAYWLTLYTTHTHPKSTAMAHYTWQQNATALIEILKTLTPENHYQNRQKHS